MILESIPVGCVPPALVATTRWQYRGVGNRGRSGILTSQKGPGTRGTYPLVERIIDRHL